MSNVYEFPNVTCSVEFTIANGESLSAAAVIGGLSPAALIMPSAWTAANITMQASQDGTNFYNVYESDGNEYTITAAALRFILLQVADMPSVRWLKFRSGTSGTPVNQGAARTLTLVVRPV